MSASTLSRLTILVRRELWESPFAFKWTPLLIAGLNLLVIALLLIIGAKVDNQMAFTLDGIRMFAQMPDEQQRLLATGTMFSTGSLFHLVLLIVVIFYLAGCLYDDRRDRSILFWKSLPVSDTLIVASKVLTATIAAPLLYLLAIALTQLALLLIASGYGLAAGINIFTEIWAPANLPTIWLVTLYAAMVQSLWLLPIFGWLILCSAFAPRLPILIAIIVPALIGLFQHFWSFFTDFRMPDFNLMLIVLQRLGRGVVPMNIELDQIEGSNMANFGAESLISFKSVSAILLSLEMWIGVAIGLAFLAAAIWFRRRATDA